MSVELVIVSEVRLYREGLATAVSGGTAEIEVIGVYANANEVVERVERFSRAVVLVDLGGENGLAEIQRLRRSIPEVTTLALALSPDSEVEIVAAAEAGIAGYVPPSASVEELICTVEHAARGEILCTPRVAGTLVRRLASLAADRVPSAPVNALTAREAEVLELLNAGLSNKQIARQLSIRLATVKNHVHSILAKLNVKRRGEAVAAMRGAAAGITREKKARAAKEEHQYG